MSVSPREEILINLTLGAKMPPEAAEALVNAYVHELAEILRKEGSRPAAYCGASSRKTYAWFARRNANIIDPYGDVAS